MLSQEESQSIAEELSNRIRAYKRKRPNLSSQNIAKRFGISASTFNRIENLDIKTPTFEQIVRVLSGTGHDEDLVKFVESKFPHLSTLLATKTTSIGEEHNLINNKVREYLVNSRYTKMMTYIMSKKKASRRSFKEEYGNDGLVILDELIEDEVVQEENGQLFISKDYQYIPNISDIRDIFINLLQTAFDIKGAQQRKSANLISLQVKSLNAEKVLPLFYDKLSEIHHEFNLISNNPDYAGNDPIYIGLVCDSIVPNKIFVRKEAK